MNLTNKQFKYIIGGCFGLCALMQIILAIEYGKMSNDLLARLIGFALLTSSMFIENNTYNYVLGIIGGCLITLDCFAYAGEVADMMSSGYSLSTYYKYDSELASALLNLCLSSYTEPFYYLFLTLIYVFKRFNKNTKTINLLCIAVGLFELIMNFISSSSFRLILISLCLIVAPLMILQIDYNVLNNINIRIGNTNSSFTDDVEKLTQLKDLLDKNIITKEEFEEKKKEILDSKGGY